MGRDETEAKGARRLIAAIAAYLLPFDSNDHTRIASEFGFTPASRSRIATPSPAEPSLFDRLDKPPDEPAA